MENTSYPSKKANKKILETYQKERYPHAKWTMSQTITIGELIEGFCAAEQGKEFIPEKKDMMLDFLIYHLVFLRILKMV